MNHIEYKKAREKRGSQAQVAQLLGVHVMTISMRERGKFKITGEAASALLALPDPTKRKKGKAKR